MIAVFSNIPCCRPIPYATFATWARLLNSGISPLGVWILVLWSVDRHHLTRKVRASSYWFRLVLTEIPLDSPLLGGNCSLLEGAWLFAFQSKQTGNFRTCPGRRLVIN